MALPILAKGITSALTKKGKDAKKDDKVSAQKLLPNSTTSPAKSRAQFSKVEPRKLAPYRKKVETTKFLPPSKVDEKFSIDKLDALLTSLVGSTANLQKITKKDLGDVRKGNRTKDNIKQKSKRERNEEKTESKKTIAKVSKPMKLTVPSLFGDIFKMGGRLVLSLGIMELLKFLDPEKKESIFGFLTEHLDKIILGTLGILGVAFVASFLPVISMVGTILSIVSPVILALGGILLPVLAAGGLALYLKHVGMETITNLAGGEAFLEEHRIIEEKLRSTGVDTFIELDGTRKGRIKNPDYKPAVGPGGTSSGGLQYLDVMKSGSQEQKDAYSAYENRRAEIEKIKTQRDDELKGVEDEQKRAEIESKYFDILQGTDTNLRGFSKPQTPVMGEDTKGSGDTKGSVVEYLTGDRSHSKYRADHGAGNYHEHLAFNTTEERDSAISLLKSNGIAIGSMNDGRHAPGSYHYVDKAFDVPLYPNIQNLGISDNKEGEEKFSAMVRKILYKGGFKGKGMGEGLTQSPGTITPKKPPNKTQKVSSTASYEETGLQVAMIQVPLPVPMPLPGGGGGASSGGSRSSGGIDIDNIILAESFSNA